MRRYERDATRSRSLLGPSPIGSVPTHSRWPPRPGPRRGDARRGPRNQADRPSQSIRRVVRVRRGVCVCAREAWRPRATVAPAADRRRGSATGTSTWARAGTGAPSRGSSPPPASSSAPGGSASLTVLSPPSLPSLALAFRIWSIKCDLRRLGPNQP